MVGIPPAQARLNDRNERSVPVASLQGESESLAVISQSEGSALLNLLTQAMLKEASLVMHDEALAGFDVRVDDDVLETLVPSVKSSLAQRPIK
jgi:ABC-type molybdenum transport system ATPase subunit/photorepair protein PhrA